MGALAVCALGFYVVLFGPQKVSSAVDHLNSALAQLGRRRAEIPASVQPPPVPSRVQWLVADRALSPLGLALAGAAKAPTLASIPELEEDGGDSAVLEQAVS